MNKPLEEKKAVVKETQQEETGLLNRILEEGRLALDKNQAEHARDMVSEFVQTVMQGQVVVGKNVEATIAARVAQIDKLISTQLNEIMHHEDFQKLEGSWRGLHHLVFESETGPT